MPVIQFPVQPEAGDTPRLRIERAQFFADIITDKQSHPVTYIVILQQQGSPLVRGISQHQSIAEARKSAGQRLERLAARAA